jgi:pimeloyl-ACP methyl ester carboxylesterase
MIRNRTVELEGVKVFFREAGHPQSPAIVLLHGYPSSSSMFRELMPLLAERFHVIAPDLVGFGHSDAPSVQDFTYTFEHLAQVTGKLLAHLELPGYLLYAQDYGGPIAMHLAQANPDKVRGLVIQNANLYMEGVSETVAGVFLPLWKERTPATEAPARNFMTAAMTQFQYTAGARDPQGLNPDSWTLDQALLDRPGQTELQLALFVD